MKTNIMLVTYNTSMFGNTEKELNRKDVKLHMISSIENAIEKFQQGGIDIVLISNDIDITDKRKLQKLFNLLDENISVIEIADTADIKSAITNALHHQIKNNFSIIDDALANARFNIRIEA